MKFNISLLRVSGWLNGVSLYLAVIVLLLLNGYNGVQQYQLYAVVGLFLSVTFAEVVTRKYYAYTDSDWKFWAGIAQSSILIIVGEVALHLLSIVNPLFTVDSLYLAGGSVMMFMSSFGLFYYGLTRG